MKSCMFVLKKELYSSLCESAIYMTFQNNSTLNKTNLAKKEDNFYEKYHLLFLWKSSIVKKIWIVFNLLSKIPYGAERYVQTLVVGFHDPVGCFFPSQGRVICNSSNKNKHRL